MSEKMITTNECEKCNYSILDETNKAKIIIYCKLKIKNIFMDSVFLVIIKILHRKL
ncbi:hypothetical protein C823_007705 [Eubacterium plexicaudatum ASF492]|nr:hypothetical protein C823_007705 [Eubacterium plexicaudatum ASF492]